MAAPAKFVALMEFLSSSSDDDDEELLLLSKEQKLIPKIIDFVEIVNKFDDEQVKYKNVV